VSATGLPAPPDDATAWSWVAEERIALADRLAGLDAPAWDGPSLCAGWRVRDVVGHLVWLAEASRPSATIDILRQHRPPSAAIVRIGRREGRADPAELLDRLRRSADGRFVVITQPPVMALGEVLVHGSDALRPAGGERRPADDLTGLVADAYRGVGFVFGARPAAKVRFTADDADWSVGPADGPEASGPGEAVLLALAGRPEGAADLSGPGTALLRS